MTNKNPYRYPSLTYTLDRHDTLYAIEQTIRLHKCIKDHPAMLPVFPLCSGHINTESLDYCYIDTSYPCAVTHEYAQDNCHTLEMLSRTLYSWVSSLDHVGDTVYCYHRHTLSTLYQYVTSTVSGKDYTVDHLHELMNEWADNGISVCRLRGEKGVSMYDSTLVLYYNINGKKRDLVSDTVQYLNYDINFLLDRLDKETKEKRAYDNRINGYFDYMMKPIQEKYTNL